MDTQLIFIIGMGFVTFGMYLLSKGQKNRAYRKGQKDGFARAEQLSTIQLAMTIEHGPDSTLLMDAPHYTRGYWSAITETFLKRVDRPL